MRTLKRNKKTTLFYSNRVEEVQTEWGSTISTYGEICSFDVFALPITNPYEAQSYGVDLLTSRKVFLDECDICRFNRFTNIWIHCEPNETKTNSEYRVVEILPTLNGATMIIDKVAGKQ